MSQQVCTLCRLYGFGGGISRNITQCWLMRLNGPALVCWRWACCSELLSQTPKNSERSKKRPLSRRSFLLVLAVRRIERAISVRISDGQKDRQPRHCNRKANHLLSLP